MSHIANVFFSILLHFDHLVNFARLFVNPLIYFFAHVGQIDFSRCYFLLYVFFIDFEIVYVLVYGVYLVIYFFLNPISRYEKDDCKFNNADK